MPGPGYGGLPGKGQGTPLTVHPRALTPIVIPLHWLGKFLAWHGLLKTYPHGERTSVKVSPRWQEQHQKFPISTSSLMVPSLPQVVASREKKATPAEERGLGMGEQEGT